MKIIKILSPSALAVCQFLAFKGTFLRRYFTLFRVLHAEYIVVYCLRHNRLCYEKFQCTAESVLQCDKS